MHLIEVADDLGACLLAELAWSRGIDAVADSRETPCVVWLKGPEEAAAALAETACSALIVLELRKLEAIAEVVTSYGGQPSKILRAAIEKRRRNLSLMEEENGNV